MVAGQAGTPVFPADVVIIGGCGRVGLPFGVALASRGLSVRLYDLNETAVATVNEGRMPFAEDGADEPLRAAAADGSLRATTDPAVVGTAEVLIVVVGTPVDEHLNPDLGAVPRALDRVPVTCRRPVIVLRSTVFPRVTALTERMMRKRGLRWTSRSARKGSPRARPWRSSSACRRSSARTAQAGDRAAEFFRPLPTRSSGSSLKRPSWRSCLPTPGVISSSPPPISSG